MIYLGLPAWDGKARANPMFFITSMPLCQVKSTSLAHVTCSPQDSQVHNKTSATLLHEDQVASLHLDKDLCPPNISLKEASAGLWRSVADM
jgi:hypothetical protein